MKKEVQKKICLLTGASSGLGKHIAKILCGKGFIVYVTARSKDKLEALRIECEGSDDGEIRVIAGDLSEANFRKRLVSKVLKEVGGIDYLINNAALGQSSVFEEQEFEIMEKIVQVNILAYQHLTKLILPSMKKRRSGRLIHVGSVVAFTPLPYFTSYNASKAATYMFNRSLRYELRGSGVTSTIVLPARMKTGFADSAYKCYKEKGQDVCAKDFNKIAGSAYDVAETIVKKMDSGREVITPTPRAGFWYFMRYFGWVVDLSMSRLLGPKELEKIKNAQVRK